ncbi:MAG: amino acid adenylation domain-containing protein, partial [bacterium]|nr:amino acid adenylation domain-containing protein [bacterium]
NQMVREQADAFSTLRHLLFGGEAVDPHWVREALAGGPPERLLHVYGPTESTTFTTWHRVREVAAGARTVPIGGPLANTELYVLDRTLAPVPAGVAGELLIGGDGLARGYFKRPGLTAERFVPNPLSGNPFAIAGGGERLYRTGDLVRYLPAGAIEFLGRLDFQVKVRGLRIELGEIEAVLRRHPAVGEVVVTAATPDPERPHSGDRRLVAYVAAEEAATTPAELREHLLRSLPDYMVPAAFVLLEALPLGPTGKVDRRGLPAPGPSALEAAERFVAPRDPLEETVAGIWAEVLAVGEVRPEVGVHDNFFALGGHSLLATRVQSRLRRDLGIELPLRVLFEQPTVAGLAGAVAAALRRKDGIEAPPLRLRARQPGETGPLSFAQQRLWFIDRFEPDSALYNVPALIRLAGPLDRGALARALGEIVRRHEVLRTRFEAVEGVPLQVIEPVPPEGDKWGVAELPLPVFDLSALAQPARRAAADQLTRRETQRSFDLESGPVLRTVLLQLDAGPDRQEHVLCLTVHHIAFDGWSIGVFLRELELSYRTYVTGRSQPLPELEVQYTDFAVWQRQWLRGEILEAQLGYWRERLAGLPVLELPCDRPRPAVQSFRGAMAGYMLPEALHRRLQAFSEQRGVTLFMTLLAAFQALLGRLTGQRDFAVGTPVANRNRAETEGLIGFFVNTLVLRADLSGAPASPEPTFAHLLARARDVALGAYAHQDVPFEKLVEELEPERNLGQNPMFQVFFALYYAPAAIRELGPGLRVGLEGAAVEQAKFDLTLSLSVVEEGLANGLEYNTDLFDITTIHRLAGHLETLLAGAVADPERGLSELPLLSAAEMQQAMREWTDPAALWPPWVLPEGTLGELFAAQAKRRPEAVAVIAGGSPGGGQMWGSGLRQRVLSYRELNARANQVAHSLRALGVRPEIPVGIAAERGIELVVGLWGILKAGGVYLPLDPGLPEERLGFMLRDAGARVVLVQESLAGALPPASAHRVDVLYLDGPQAEVPAGAGTKSPEPYPLPENPPLRGNPPFVPLRGNLAYVIYTSGTTGVPKGVAVTHRQVLPVLSWVLRYFPIDERTRVLQTLSHWFDFGLFELLTTLLGGGTLYFLPAAEQADPSRYPEAIAQQALNTVHATPSFFRELLLRGEDLTGLETVHLGGEALSRHLVREIEAVAGAGCRVYNGYGPTEVSINSAMFPMRNRPLDREFRGETVPIGKVTARSSGYVLDHHLRPLPVGVPGELLIAGEGLARGYLHRPALTAEHFVPHPFARSAGERLYRSGDLVRWLPEGNLGFLGRIDHQVKVRGYRIELGEIESVLAGFPGIREVVVVAPESERVPGGRELVAYLTGEPTAVRDLRGYLQVALPPAMVPGTFVFLDRLPRLPSGKLDRAALARRALPEPMVATEGFVPPRDPTEELLAGIWEEVLGRGASDRARIGIHDDFFALGGHSLLATQVVSRVRTVLGVELPLLTLFEEPTVAGFATCVAAALRREEGLEAPPIQPLAHGDRVPLSFAQQRLWFIDRFQPDSALYNLPSIVHLHGHLDRSSLACALNHIVRRHQVLRTVFETTAGEPVQVVQPPWELPLPLCDLGGLGAEDRRAEACRLAGAEARKPFDLARGPMLRVMLLRLADPPECEAHTLVLNVHHIAFDGWSLGVFLRELQALYQAFSGGRSSSLPELEVQYADFAVWQRQWLRGEALEGQLDYWRRQLDGLPVLELPCDRPRPAVQSFRGSLAPFQLRPELSHRLEELSRAHGGTLFMTLLSAFQLLLG